MAWLGLASNFSYVIVCCILERAFPDKRPRLAYVGYHVPSATCVRGASRCLLADRKSASRIKVVCWSHSGQPSAPCPVHLRALCDLLAELGADLVPDRFSDEWFQSAGKPIPGISVYVSCNERPELGSQLDGAVLLIYGLPLPCAVSEILRDFLTCRDLSHSRSFT